MLVPEREMEQAPARKARRPVIDLPRFDMEPFFRVLLHYTGWQETDQREIARKLRMAVHGLSTNDSMRIVRLAEQYRTAIVKTVPKKEAIDCKERIERFGLHSSIEEA